MSRRLSQVCTFFSLLFIGFSGSSALARLAPGAKPPQIVTITGMELGDVACYLTYKNLEGKVEEALAVHDLCSQVTLLNKRSRIIFRQAQVLGDSCEGDPECDDLKTVWLVDRANEIAQLLCRQDEILYHGCMLKDGKSLSFCTRKMFKHQFDVLPDYLVVRMGKDKNLQMEIDSKSHAQFKYRMQRLAGPNTRQVFRWTHASKVYLFESSYLNGSRLHGLSTYQNGKKIGFDACFDHDPKEEVMLIPADL